MATFLQRSEKLVKSVIYDQIPTIRDNLSETFILKKETTGCTSLPILNSGVTGPQFTKFTNGQIITGELLKIRMAILQSVSSGQTSLGRLFHIFATGMA